MTADFPSMPQTPLVDSKGDMSVPWSGWFTQIMRTLNALGGVPPTPTSPAVLATAYKGNWSDIVTYYPGDESSYTGNLYRAIEESLNVVPANGTYWLLIGPLTQDALIDGAQFVRLANNHAVGNVAYNFRGVWNSGDTYVTGDEVVYGQTYWVALANSMNSAPATGNANWQVVGSYSAFQGAWSASTAYVVGSEATYSGNYWVAIAPSTNSAPSTSNANWQIAGPATLDDVANGMMYSKTLAAWIADGVPYNYQGAYSASTQYPQGAEVSSGGNYWLAIAASTNQAPPNATYWQLLGPSSLDDVANGTSRFAVTNAAGMAGVSSVDGNNRALIDFSQSGHIKKILDNIGDGVYVRTTSMFAGQNMIDNPSFEASSNLPPEGWSNGNNGFGGIGRATLSYDIATPHSGNQSLIVTCAPSINTGIGPGRQFSTAGSQAYFYRFWAKGNWSAFVKDSAGGQIYPSGNYTEWTEVSGTYTTEPGAVWMIIGWYGSDTTFEIDDAYLVRINNMDTEVEDGSNFLRMPAPPGVSAAATTSLSQHGNSTTINVGASTFYLGNITLNVNSGSVNPGSYGKYYVYFDGPGYAGGAVIFQATTDATVLTQAPFRFYLGTITTVSGGGGSGGGGGIGGSGCCLHESQLIELADGRTVAARELTTDMHLLCPEGPTPVVQLRFLPHREWYKVTFNNGIQLFVAGDHRFLDVENRQLRAWDLKPKQMVQAKEGYVHITAIEVLWDDAIKVAIEVGEPHTYFVQGILSHNKELC